MENDIITTERLTLRHFKKEDSIPLHPIFADAEVMRFWSTPAHQNMAETEELVRKTIEANEKGTSDDFVVVYNGEVIGKAGLWKDTEIGFIFALNMWGMGIASEAVQAVITRAAQKGHSKVLADVDPRNERCIQLLKKNGFVETGRAKSSLCVAGTWVDSIYFEADFTK
jgi:ribosomal-protein-alanine N-acetyltransferase